MKRMKNSGIHMMVPENRVDEFMRNGWSVEQEPVQELDSELRPPKKGSSKPEQEG